MPLDVLGRTRATLTQPASTPLAGSRYEGEYKGGSRTGQGTYHYWNGNKYEGGFKNNLFDGEGTFIEFTGWKMSVVWNEGIPHKYRNGQLIVKRTREESDYLEQQGHGKQSYYGVNRDLLELLNPDIVNAIKEGKCTYSVSGTKNYVACTISTVSCTL